MSDPLVTELRDWLADYNAGKGFAVKPSVVEFIRRAADALETAEAERDTLRKALEQITQMGFVSRLSEVREIAESALAAVPASAAPPVAPRKLLYFAQRQHPTDYGMLQVRAFTEEAARDALLTEWRNAQPALHPHGWEREVDHDTFQDIAGP